MPSKNIQDENNRFFFYSTPLEGLYVAERRPIKDHRGFFCRFFCAEEFQRVGLSKAIVQINHSYTKKKGVVRGFHFQYPPHAELKIVSCLRGEVFDVAVDIRKGSPTFLQWHGEILNPENRKSLLIPEGFAHGFQTLTENCELIYLVSTPYCTQAEGALHFKDPRIGVVWPIPVVDISVRDRSQPLLKTNFEGIVL